MRRLVLLATLASTGLAVSLAQASVVPVEFDRSVRSSAIVSDGTKLADVDDDFVPWGADGVFDETSMASAETVGATATSSSFQVSTITPTTITAVGGFTTSAETTIEEATAEAFGLSNVVYRFEVTSETTFVLTGSVEAVGQGGANVFLVSASTRPVDVHLEEGILELDEAGTLAPGAYIFQVVTSGWGQQFPGHVAPASGAFDLSFELAAAVSVPSGDVAIAPVSVRPNPTRGAVTFTVDEPVSGARIFDTDGRLVQDLALAPTTRVVWDGRRSDGARAAAGIYFVRLSSGASGRVTLLP